MVNEGSAEAGQESDQRGASCFSAELRRLRADAGDPAFRTMALRSGGVSHTTLHEAARGNRFPSWPTTQAFVTACGGDLVEWRRRWEDARPRLAESVVHHAVLPESVVQRAVLPESDLTEVVMPASPVSVADEVTPGKQRPRRYRGWTVAVLGSVVVVLAAVTVVLISRSGSQSAAAGSSLVAVVGPAVAGDASGFVADVTIPDGTRVTVDERFQKVWEIANIGTVSWHGRYLRRLDLPPGPNTCQTPSQVLIGDTDPGQDAWISVDVVAPSMPGTCWVGWKMVDATGKEYLPNERPLFFLVTVVPAAAAQAGPRSTP